MPTDTKTTILFLTANPLDTDQLRPSVEVRDIKATLRQAEYGRRFDVQEEWAVRISDLRRALLRYADQPLILHLSGHGDAGAIYLEYEVGRTQPVAAQALARFLVHFPNIQCVVLNACYSNEVGDALVTVAPCVVGMATDVTDVAAIQFAEAFYDAIGAGKSFAHAFRLAETSAEMEGSLDFVRPVFRGRVVPPATPPVEKQELAELMQLAEDMQQTPTAGGPTAAQPATATEVVDVQPRIDEVERERAWLRAATKLAEKKWFQIGIEMVHIPAGEFLYGDNRQRINLTEYWIAKTPVTNELYRAFVDATGHRMPVHWKNGEIPAGKADHPVVEVSWEDATVFCQWAGVALPSERQWEKAARGTDGRKYPWGDAAPDRNFCNFGKSVGDTVPVGKHPLGASPYGLLNMAGNVWEWCADLVEKTSLGRYGVERGLPRTKQGCVARLATGTSPIASTTASGFEYFIRHNHSSFGDHDRNSQAFSPASIPSPPPTTLAAPWHRIRTA